MALTLQKWAQKKKQNAELKDDEEYYKLDRKERRSLQRKLNKRK